MVVPVIFSVSVFYRYQIYSVWVFSVGILECRRAEELLLKHEDDELVLIVLYCFGRLHIHGVLTSTVVDTDSDDMMEMN